MIVRHIPKSRFLLMIFPGTEFKLNGRIIIQIQEFFVYYSGTSILINKVSISLIFRYHRKDAYPFGIQKIEIFHKSRFMLTIIPPGGFYTIARKSNELEIEKDNSYGYSITYGFFKKFNKNNITCKESLNFLEDECKMNQVK